jgi:hypothetical protein
MFSLVLAKNGVYGLSLVSTSLALFYATVKAFLETLGMKTYKNIDPGFNNIRPWLSRKLKERGMSVDRFSVATGSRINSAAIRTWYSDACRPYQKTMRLVCHVLRGLATVDENGAEKGFEEVPWSEGLATYTPRPRAWNAHYATAPSGRAGSPPKLRKK